MNVHLGLLVASAIALSNVAHAARPCPAAQPTTRHYYVQAEEVPWDFGPSGQDLTHGGPIPAPWTNYTKWTKTRYIEYTDHTFTVKKPQPQWLGVLGPIIRAVVGDKVIVHFQNRANGYFGVHPHGFRYTKDNEGAHYLPMGMGAQIPPGGSHHYEWIADEASGPGPADPSSLVWWYHSHVNEPLETNAGLLGPIVITRRDSACADATPSDVDKEFVAAFFIFNEDRGRERGLMHSINGYIFGNLQGLDMNNGDKVRWYMLGMGNEVDLHSPHWHGKTVTYNGRHTDVIELLPASMVTVDMDADNPGRWMLHCHVADHIDAGMYTTYTIH